MNVYRFLRLAFWVLTALASGLLAASASSAQGISGRFSSLLDQVSIARGAEEIAPESSAFGCGSGGATARATQSAADYVLFEGGAVRPLALSPDGSKLAVANTPANCLEIYQVSDQQLQLESSVMVGVEPVAVAFNGSDEVWVVNHLSDSVSVVSLAATPRVIATLQVGDEPRDIVSSLGRISPVPLLAPPSEGKITPSLRSTICIVRAPVAPTSGYLTPPLAAQKSS